ncbi:MAG: hypothetical protein ACREDL_24715 [Bradyrhizobium sp.]
MQQSFELFRAPQPAGQSTKSIAQPAHGRGPAAGRVFDEPLHAPAFHDT